MDLSLCRAAYACSLNSEAGPVPGVIYQSNRSLAFCSDKPVAYPTVDGHSEQAAYKVRLDTAFWSDKPVSCLVGGNFSRAQSYTFLKWVRLRVTAGFCSLTADGCQLSVDRDLRSANFVVIDG
jgi:hypothetical protein